MLLYTIWGMAWLESPKRVAASSDIAWARSMHLLNPGLPNGTSHPLLDAPYVEREPAELKHLSRQRKRKQIRDAVSNVEQKRQRTN